MNRRTFLQGPLPAAAASAGMGAAWAAQTSRPQAAERRRRPNVIWLFADQHRAQALGCNGDPNANSPNIDNLAVNGVNFTHAVSSFPLCCPFRGSLLTGRHAHQCVVGHEYPLPEGQPTIAQPFHENGYHTAYFGKWHLSGWKERDGRSAFHITNPSQRGGFKTWVGYDNNNSQWDSWVHGGAGKDAFHYRLPGYETDELTNLLIRFLREQGELRSQGKEQPFFAVLSVQPPHDPYVAPAEFMGKYRPGALELRPNVPVAYQSLVAEARRDLAGYYAMIENWDWNIGRVLKALNETGMAFDTHLVVFSDHGDMHGSQGMFRKTNPFEESIRIPFVLTGAQPRYDGWRTGRVPTLLQTVDIAPTTLGLCGIEKPAWMQGTDFSGHRLQNRPQSSEPDSAYLQLVVPTGHAHSINRPYRGIVTRDGWKYVCFSGVPFTMFNLEQDPLEQVNLAHNNRYKNERLKLQERLKQWVADTGDRFDIPSD